MYHYTESGLQNVWLIDGYVIRKTPYGKSVAIHDVEALHRVIGRSLANQPKLTGAALRFLRKEMGLSQAALALLVGTSEQNISLWERRGRIPKSSDRLIRVLYLEQTFGDNVKIKALIERINALDKVASQEKLTFAQADKNEWKEAA
jgi:DNA-binding transcriptional regulator YiaG